MLINIEVKMQFENSVLFQRWIELLGIPFFVLVKGSGRKKVWKGCALLMIVLIQ
jgi:hypothetical protein